MKTDGTLDFILTMIVLIVAFVGFTGMFIAYFLGYLGVAVFCFGMAITSSVLLCLVFSGFLTMIALLGSVFILSVVISIMCFGLYIVSLYLGLI